MIALPLPRIPRCLAAFIAAAAFGCAEADGDREGRATAPGDTPEGTARAGTESDAEDPPFVIETVASGLATPWAMAFAPDGRIFVTERAGRIRVIYRDTLLPEPWATLDVVADGETGLMGIAVAPDFATSRHVYVVGTFRTPDREFVNRVVRLTDRNGKGVEPTIIIDSIPAAKYHAGDAIAFGPDRKLYVATGDAREPGTAQEEESLAGKILRYEADGRIPGDNPDRGSPVWASGLRNPQGIAWEPWTKQLFAVDHGPSGFPSERLRRHHDEVNAIRAGGNYGWPEVAGAEDDDRYVAPMLDWTPAIAPAGLAVYTGEDFPAWRGNLFVGALRGAQLRRVAVARGSEGSSGWRVLDEQVMVHGLGRIRAVGMGRDGYLYFATSNHDGRGKPAAEDDRLMRLVPVR